MCGKCDFKTVLCYVIELYKWEDIMCVKEVELERFYKLPNTLFMDTTIKIIMDDFHTFVEFVVQK